VRIAVPVEKTSGRPQAMTVPVVPTAAPQWHDIIEER
jgi:hypothetical protein